MSKLLVLASQSPRRRQLLQQVGFEFEVQAAAIDESRLTDERPDEYVKRIASLKAQRIAELYPHAVILAADTIVQMDDQILLKPNDFEDACRIWQQLSGRCHEVKTTIVLQCAAVAVHHQTVQTVSTRVYFKPLTFDDMVAYWHSGEPLDKAGGYAIQGRAATWVTGIEGSYSNVVGLPLFETSQQLELYGIRPDFLRSLP